MNHLNELIAPGKLVVLLTDLEQLEKAATTTLNCPIESLPKDNNVLVEVGTPAGPVMVVKLGWWQEVPTREQLGQETELLRRLFSDEYSGKTCLVIAEWYGRVKNPRVYYRELNLRCARMVLVAKNGDYALVIRDKYGPSQTTIEV